MSPRKKIPRYEQERDENAANKTIESFEESPHSSPRKALCQNYTSPTKTGSWTYTVIQTPSKSPLRVGTLKLKLNVASAVSSESDSRIFHTALLKPNFNPRGEKNLRRAELSEDEFGKLVNCAKCSLEKKVYQDKNEKLRKYERRLAKVEEKLKKIDIRRANLIRHEEKLQNLFEKTKDLRRKIDWLQDKMPVNLRRESEEAIIRMRSRAKLVIMSVKEMEIYIEGLKEELENEKKGFECLKKKCHKYFARLERNRVIQNVEMLEENKNQMT